MLNTQDYHDKKILAAVREYHELSQKRYTIMKLDRPIQRGWRRLHVLTISSQNRPDRSVLEAMLEVIGVKITHHNRDFRRKSRRRSRKLVEIEQPLRPIPVHEWLRKNYPEKWQDYFRCEMVPLWDRSWHYCWVFKEPALYELRIEPNWLWYFREIDPAVESRLDDLGRWLETLGGWRRYSWLKGCPRYLRWKGEMEGRQKSLRKVHEREIRRALQNFPEVDPGASVWCIRISLRVVISSYYCAVPVLSRFIEQELARLDTLAEPEDADGDMEALDGFFRSYAAAA